jgi:hypothetical protein
MGEIRSVVFPATDLARNHILNVAFDVDYTRFAKELADAAERLSRTSPNPMPMWTWRHAPPEFRVVVKEDHPPIEF